MLNKNFKTIFITGGAGFIGSHLADVLVQEKRKVTVFDNLSTGKKHFLSGCIKSKNFKFIKGDLLNKKLLSKSLPKETEKSIIEIIEAHPDVIFQHNLKTRKIGNIFAIDVHIKLDKDISFVKSHDVATEIEVSLREKFGSKTVTNIHTEPYVKK